MCIIVAIFCASPVAKNCAFVVTDYSAHDLSVLWQKSQETLKQVWHDEFETAPQDISDFINELHSIDVKSENFRYPIDKTGKETLEKVNAINFKLLSDIFKEAKYYLDGATAVLAVARENNCL